MTHASITTLAPLRRTRARPASSRTAFSLTELLVVIGIIVLLMGLLFVALRGAMTTARETRSKSTITQFSNACTAFQQVHGRYPGVIPEDVLKFHHQNDPVVPTLSSTENALLDLMGGYRLLTPADVDATPASAIEKDYIAFINPATNPGVFEMTFDAPGGQEYKLAYVRRRLGEGPVINGKPYQPSYTPGSNELVAIEGQMNEQHAVGDRLPEPVDAWGQPLVYIRQSRPRGPLRPDPAQLGVLPQFELAGVASYVGWPTPTPPPTLPIGEMGQDQMWSNANAKGSILTIGGDAIQNQTFAAIVGHPSFYRPPPGNPLAAAPGGQFIVISAGEDGIYFSFADGPFLPTDASDAPLAVQTKIINVGPKVISEFNDIVSFGGG